MTLVVSLGGGESNDESQDSLFLFFPTQFHPLCFPTSFLRIGHPHAPISAMPPSPPKARPERPLAKLMGVGIYYSDSPVGLPPVMTHFLKNIDALHGVGGCGSIDLRVGHPDALPQQHGEYICLTYPFFPR